MRSDELIEFIFYHETEIIVAVREKRLDPGKGYTGGNCTGHSKISDPTAMQGIVLASPVPTVSIDYGAAIGGIRNSQRIRQPEKWLQIVCEVRRFYAGKKQGELLKRRYQQGEAWTETCKGMDCNRACYYAMKNDLVKLAESLAIGYGLLSPWHNK